MKQIVFIFLLLFTFITSFGFVVNAEFVLPPDEGGGTPFTEGILTIYSDGTTNSSGSSSASFIPLLAGTHSFIYFHNIGNTSANLGVYNVLPNQSVSIGIYGNKIDNLGVWYNLEQYFYDEVGAYL